MPDGNFGDNCKGKFSTPQQSSSATLTVRNQTMDLWMLQCFTVLSAPRQYLNLFQLDIVLSLKFFDSLWLILVPVPSGWRRINNVLFF